MQPLPHDSAPLITEYCFGPVMWASSFSAFPDFSLPSLRFSICLPSTVHTPRAVPDPGSYTLQLALMDGRLEVLQAKVALHFVDGAMEDALLSFKDGVPYFLNTTVFFPRCLRGYPKTPSLPMIFVQYLVGRPEGVSPLSAR